MGAASVLRDYASDRILFHLVRRVQIRVCAPRRARSHGRVATFADVIGVPFASMDDGAEEWSIDAGGKVFAGDGNVFFCFNHFCPLFPNWNGRNFRPDVWQP